MFQVCWKGLSKSDFIAHRDSLDGGLGCLEPYFESVPQVFIQTAFFTIANSLKSTSTRLCYNEKIASCQYYDVCSQLNKCSYLGYDNNHCNPVGLEPYGYKTHKEVLECEMMTRNCTDGFEECIQPFYSCIENCTSKLIEHISAIDEYQLFQSYANGNNEYVNDSLVIEYDATLEDLKKIQLYRLFIGDYDVFMSTYIISIIAATYGVTKFFRLGHARHTHDVFSVEYIVTCIVTAMYLIAKGVCLAMFMLVHENEMYENVLWWFTFCMLPPFIFAFMVMVSRTCYKKSTKDCFKCYSNYTPSSILKQPPLIAAPVITPFVYSMKSKSRFDYEPILNNTMLLSLIHI